MQNYNYNRNCEFSDDIVSYLYGENNSAEKSVFESHLAKCSNCADELAAFSEVHSAVENWRVTEFDGLSTPQIIVPYHESAVRRGFVQTVEPISVGGWRRIFDFGFAWKTAAAMAVLAIFGAVFLFALKFNQPAQVAVAELPVVNSTVNPAPPSEPAPTIASVKPVSTEVRKSNSIISPTLKSPAKPLPAAVRQLAAKSVRSFKVDNAVIKSPKNSGIKQLPVSIVADNSYKSLKSPRLTTDEEERGDDSLRLAELFDETDKIN